MNPSFDYTFRNNCNLVYHITAAISLLVDSNKDIWLLPTDANLDCPTLARFVTYVLVCLIALKICISSVVPPVYQGSKFTLFFTSDDINLYTQSQPCIICPKVYINILANY